MAEQDVPFPSRDQAEQDRGQRLPLEPQRRPRGRPRKSAQEREAERVRRIPRSQEGRMQFRPGEPHALDVEFKEAQNLRLLVKEELARIQQLAHQLEQQDASAAISTEEQALKAFLWQTYQEHKHRDHIVAVFLAIRRRWLRARLQAAYTALEIASDLLIPDTAILQALQRALHQKPEPQVQEPPIVRDTMAEAETPEAQQGEQVQMEQMTHRHIYGDAHALKEQLAAFDERMRAIRATISAGIGWFKEFFVPKERLKPTVVALLNALDQEQRHHQRVPMEVQQRVHPRVVALFRAGRIHSREDVPDDLVDEVYEVIQYGPYLKYRWRESGYGPIYTVSMGRIPDEELVAAERWRAILSDGEQEEPPWPQL